MIDNGKLIKTVRSRGFIDWPEKVKQLINRLSECKLGFPGIGNNHISLLELNQIGVGDIFIYDPYLTSDTRGDDYVPYLLEKLSTPRKYLIHGIGKGLNKKDPERLIRWKDTIELTIRPDELVLRVDVRPKETGGPGYFYFYRSYRDQRL